MASTLYARSGADFDATARVGPGLTAPSSLKEIPYDYVATFQLQGRIGNRIQDVVNISVDGAFVAVAIGYSFLPPRPDPAAPVANAAQAGRIAAQLRVTESLAARNAGAAAGFANVWSAALRRLLRGAPGLAVANPTIQPETIAHILNGLETKCSAIDFLYQIVDSGSGRDLQNQPIHNVAGLGSADGGRPFRPLAKPMLFMPRSTIRIEVIEQSQGHPFIGGQLYMVLHGYKILGYGAPAA